MPDESVPTGAQQMWRIDSGIGQQETLPRVPPLSRHRSFRAHVVVVRVQSNSFVRVVFDACKRLCWSAPATGSNCKSRDYQQLHSEHTLPPCGIGNPSKHLFQGYRQRTRGRRHKLGRTKFRTTLPLRRQPHQLSASRRFLPRQFLFGFACLL